MSESAWLVWPRPPYFRVLLILFLWETLCYVLKILRITECVYFQPYLAS